MSEAKISDIVARLIERDSNLSVFMSEGLINFYAFARKYRKDIQEELGKEADISSISMAARRYIRACERIGIRKLDFDLVVSDRMIDYNVKCTPQVLDELAVLHATHPDSEMNVSICKDNLVIIVHERNESVVESNRSIFENTIFKLRDLACVRLKFKGDFLNTPGVIYNVLKLLQTKGINVIEIFSSNMELVFVIKAISLKIAYSLLSGYFLSK